MQPPFKTNAIAVRLRCRVPPGDVNQLTINAGSLMDSRYASKKTTFTVLTVPRALSRIHRNGKSIWLTGRR
ncbi:hypothetical protein DY339_16940 [Escherichia coli]|nr:hypothetical protein [Escherichia coli]